MEDWRKWTLIAVAVLGLAGTLNETYVLNGLQTPIAQNFQHQYHWGSTDTYPHYHAGWASAGNTPSQYFKQSVHRGGMQDALVVSWPKGIKAKGEIRDQYHHIIDIAPTILDACGVEVMDEIDGIKQKPFDGVSMRYSFNDADAEDMRKEQLYEMFGNRALYQDGWKAVSLHGQRMPWFLSSVTSFDDDVWELYHVAEDFSESTNVADKYPDQLEELKARFDEIAWETNVYPLYDDMVARMRYIKTSADGGRGELWVNGKKVDECPMPKVHLSTFSLSETFDVGRDAGTQVSKIYRGQSHFTGDLDKVTFRLTDFDESKK